MRYFWLSFVLLFSCVLLLIVLAGFSAGDPVSPYRILPPHHGKLSEWFHQSPFPKKVFYVSFFPQPFTHTHTHATHTHCSFCDITAKQQTKAIILKDWELVAVKTNASLSDKCYLQGVTLHCLCKKICVCAMPRVGRCQTSLSGRNAGLFRDTGPSFSTWLSQSH